MSKLIRSIVLAFFMATFALPNALAAPESPTKGTTDSHTVLGSRLVNRYLSDVQRKDVADLRVFVSPGFQVQRADGARQNKAELLRNLPDLRSYKLRSLRVTKDADVLVVSFQAATDESINGQPLRSGYSPRLATFIRGGKGWRITAYANFNTRQEAKIIGTWAGMIRQKGVDPFRLTVTIGSLTDASRNVFHYTGINCSGTWKLLGRRGASYSFEERNDGQGGSKCINGGRVTVTALGRDRLQFRYRGDDVRSRGILTRR